MAAAQPTIGGKAPAAPPITMFCGVRRFSQMVYTNDVERDGQGQQGGGSQLSARPMTITDRIASVTPKRQGVVRLDTTARGRSPPGARHQAVDVGIVAVVDRRRRPGAEGDAQDRHRHQQGMQAAGRQKQPDRGREHHQRHHVGLEQRPVVTDLGDGRACRLELPRDRLVLHAALLDLRQLVEGVEQQQRRARPLQRRGPLTPGIWRGMARVT